MGNKASQPWGPVTTFYYINLQHRSDRRSQLLQEAKKLKIKPQRIPGVYAKFGALGCSLAHLKALQKGKKTGQPFLILEDDIQITRPFKVQDWLEHFWTLPLKWDMILLSVNLKAYEREPDPTILRVTDGQTTGAYLVHPAYVDTLINNVQEGLKKLKTFTAATPASDYHDWCIDIYWKRLQKEGAWFCPNQLYLKQRETFSDIQLAPSKFNWQWQVKNQPVRYVVAIKTCQERYRERTIRQPHFFFFQYYGDPTLTQPWVWHWNQRLLIVRAKDDYLNLPHKVGLMLQALASLFPRQRPHLFMTDEDIRLNYSQFSVWLPQWHKVRYGGNLTRHRRACSFHLRSKGRKNPAIKKQVRAYPELKKYGVAVSQVTYCSGGGAWLNCQTWPLLIRARKRWFRPFPADLASYVVDSKIKRVDVFDDLNIGVALRQRSILPKKLPIHEIVRWPGLKAY